MFALNSLHGSQRKEALVLPSCGVEGGLWALPLTLAPASWEGSSILLDTIDDVILLGTPFPWLLGHDIPLVLFYFFNPVFIPIIPGFSPVAVFFIMIR